MADAPTVDRLLYAGKTKEVFAAEDSGHLTIRYRDTVLGEDGVIDPGANRVLLEMPGKGAKTCAAAVAFFARCATAGVPTHFVRRLDTRTILVRAVRRFPIEVVLRNQACGGYLRRHPETRPFAPLGGLIEFFVKDDDAGDPLIETAAAIAGGLIPAEAVETVFALTRRVNTLLLDEFAVIDFKVEFGFLGEKIVLIDEVSADSIRLREGDRLLDYPATLERLAPP